MRVKHPFTLDVEGDRSWVVRQAWKEVFRSKSKTAAQAFAIACVGLYILKKKVTVRHDEDQDNAKGP